MDDGFGVRRGGRVRLEQVVDASAGVAGEPVSLAERQQPGLFVRGQQRKVGDRPVGVGDHLVEQAAEVACHAFDRRSVEQVGVVFKDAGDPVGRLGQAERQVEFRSAVVGVELHLAVDARQRRDVDRRVLEDE